jgi:phosphopantothenoylcysteine decarboxylase/phosphopantothenate--cysteine ligase
LAKAANADLVVMAAAVADYTPAEPVTQKMAKTGETLTLVLTRTPDILGDLGSARLASGQGPLLVGFAAETSDVVARATDKLRRKHVDMIVANDVSRSDAGFDVTTNAVTILTTEGEESLPLQSKDAVAADILTRVEALLTRRNAVAR